MTIRTSPLVPVVCVRWQSMQALLQSSYLTRALLALLPQVGTEELRARYLSGFKQRRSYMSLGHKQAVDLATRWKQVQANWRYAHLPPAFAYLKAVVTSEEYERYIDAFRAGQLEIRIDNGYIVTCLTPND